MYEEYELSKWSLFSDNYINFGYWRKLKDNEMLSVSDRTESQKNLYRTVLNKIKLSSQDKVLEIGCGLGVGSVLALNEFSPYEIKAIDFSAMQIDQARKINQNCIVNLKNISFEIGAAEKIPYSNNEFEKVFSVEAAQHFSCIDSFIKESYRVLKRNGKFAVSTFFATSDESAKLASDILVTVQNGIDKLIPIFHVNNLLLKNGFKNVCIEKIGEHVWFAFDQWIAQSEFKDTWNRNWYIAYKNGLIDYFILMADK